jgi:hypothetical protein
MIIQTKAGQKIEFRQPLDGFGYELYIIMDGEYLAVKLEREEAHLLMLDIQRKLEGGEL